jgi:hypothetical protein
MTSYYLQRYVLWDLDNCLFDDSWRFNLIDWHLEGDDRYRRYNERCAEDPLHNLVTFRLFQDLGATPVFLTGRSRECKEQTVKALSRLAIPEDNYHLYMRARGDHSSPVDLKLGMIERLHVQLHQIVAAFDDLPEVIAAYRKLGIPAKELRIHNVDAYNPPKKGGE